MIISDEAEARKFFASISESERRRLLILFAEMMASDSLILKQDLPTDENNYVAATLGKL